jgi:hypothetical protein
LILWNASSSKPTSSKTSNVIDPAEGSRPRLGLVATPTFAPMKQDHKSMRPTILAMDLEGTLISNAVSQIPRPGLYQFLESAKCLFDELVIFTTVPEPKFRQIADLLGLHKMDGPDERSKQRFCRHRLGVAAGRLRTLRPPRTGTVLGTDRAFRLAIPRR